jgi:hypothetical protein
MRIEPSDDPRRRIGFYPGPLEVRMEEEGHSPGPAPTRSLPPEVAETAFAQAFDERRCILKLFENQPAEDKLPLLSSEDKFKLLEENRKLLTTLMGGETTKFRTEHVIYAILSFSGVLIIALACFTAFWHLDAHITLTFVGTVVGSTLTIIAQKLGKIGR